MPVVQLLCILGRTSCCLQAKKTWHRIQGVKRRRPVEVNGSNNFYCTPYFHLSAPIFGMFDIGGCNCRESKPPVIAPSLSLSFTNIRSLLPKRDTIAAFLDDCNSNIVVFTETWLHPEITDHEIFPHHSPLNMFRCDCSGKKCHCVLLGTKRTLASRIVSINSSIEVVRAECQTYSNKALIGCCYRLPDTDQ